MSSVGSRMIQAWRSWLGGGTKVVPPLAKNATVPPSEPQSSATVLPSKQSVKTIQTKETQSEPQQLTSSVAHKESHSWPSETKLKAIKPHIPMIRFRKGGLPSTSPASGTIPAVGGDQAKINVPASAQGSSSIPDWAPIRHGPLEFWQVPSKYRKRELDQIEIDAINMGGRDKPYQ